MFTPGTAGKRPPRRGTAESIIYAGCGQMTTAERYANELWVCHLGTVSYLDAVHVQETVRERRLAEEIPDTLLLLEHPPVYTCGRRAGSQELPFPDSFYEAQGVAVHTTDRGGRVTYHGPGQLVGYPIMAVEDVHRHLRAIEAAVADALAQAGVQARSRHDEGIDYTGVWVQDRKIASIGVHLSRGVSTHGFAVNVDNDLEPFSWIVACGLPGVTMTSLALEAAPGAADGVTCFRRRVAYAFCRAHSRRQRLVSATRLGIAARDPARRASGRAPSTIPSPRPAAARVEAGAPA
jgi:lipoyl(octanoyl) transferase